MIKLRVSYKDENGLKKVIDKLGSEVIRWKIYKKQSGEFNKAEITLKD